MVIAIGTMVSLAYYLRVVAAVWMRPAATAAPDRGDAGDRRRRAGGRRSRRSGARGDARDRRRLPEADAIDPDAGRRPYLVGPALLAAAATVFFGVIPQPLVAWAEHAGAALAQFLP